MKRRNFLLLTFIFILFCSNIFAEKSNIKLKQEVEFLNEYIEVVYSASKFKQPIDDAPSIIKIFNREYLELINAQTVSDLLSQLCGIHLTISTESRELAWIRGVNGSDNSRILILIDGIPIKDALYTHGWIDEYLPIHMVKTVEVIKGPGSALYGANAFTGIINLITKDGLDIMGKSISFVVGKKYENRINLLAGGAVETPIGEIDVMGYAKFFRTKGLGGDYYANDNILNPKQDRPYENYSTGFKIKINKFTFKTDIISYLATRIDGKYWENNLSNIVINDEDISSYRYFNDFISLTYDNDFDVNKNLKIKIYYQYYDNPAIWGDMNFEWNDTVTIIDSSGDTVLISPGEFLKYGDEQYHAHFVVPIKKTLRYGGDLQFTLEIGDYNTVVSGIEYVVDEIEEVADYKWLFGDKVEGGLTINTWEIADGFFIKPVRIPNKAIYFQETLEFPQIKINVTAGGRYDNHKFFGSHISPRFGIVYNPMNKNVFKLLYGEAYRAPVPRELLIAKSSNWASGNPNLEPEIIKTIEAEWKHYFSKKIESKLSYFNNRIKDIIQKGNDATGDRIYLNTGKQKSQGIELEINYKCSKWNSYINYSLVHAKDVKAGTEEYGISKHIVKFGIIYKPVKQLWTSVRGRYLSTQPRFEYSKFLGRQLPDVPGYTIIDFTIGTKEIIEGLIKL